MSRFYGSMKGNRGEVTRCGTYVSGITAHCRGWDVGVRVEVNRDPEGGDRCHIYSTSGSNNSSGERLILTVKRDKITYDALGLEETEQSEQAPPPGLVKYIKTKDTMGILNDIEHWEVDQDGIWRIDCSGIRSKSTYKTVEDLKKYAKVQEAV